MKRVIKASDSSINAYEKVDPREVTYQFISNAFNAMSIILPDQILKHIRDAVCKWKSVHKLSYHHNDFNTSHNFANNIILIDTSGHSYLHHHRTQIILRHMLNLARPEYHGGKVAEHTDKLVMQRLSEKMNFVKYDASQIIDAVFSSDIFSQIQHIQSIKEFSNIRKELEYLEFLIIKSLDNSNIEWITYDDIHSVIDDYRKSLGNPDSLDVDYIDEQTGYQVLLALNDWHSSAESEMQRKSIDAIREFIRNNMQSKDEILETWAKITSGHERK